MSLPRMMRIEQRFEASRIVDIPAEVETQLASLDLAQTIRPGDTVAITAGSRGIANIAIIIKAICDHLRRLGAVPVRHSLTTPRSFDWLCRLSMTSPVIGVQVQDHRSRKEPP